GLRCGCIPAESTFIRSRMATDAGPGSWLICGSCNRAVRDSPGVRLIFKQPARSESATSMPCGLPTSMTSHRSSLSRDHSASTQSQIVVPLHAAFDLEGVFALFRDGEHGIAVSQSA